MVPKCCAPNFSNILPTLTATPITLWFRSLPPPLHRRLCQVSHEEKWRTYHESRGTVIDRIHAAKKRMANDPKVDSGARKIKKLHAAIIHLYLSICNTSFVILAQPHIQSTRLGCFCDISNLYLLKKSISSQSTLLSKF